MLMLTVINVDAYPFLRSQTRLVTIRIQDQVFSGSIVPPNSMKTQPRSSKQEASPSASKNTQVVLVPCRTQNCVPTATSGGVDIPEVPECLLRQMSHQRESQKLHQ